MLRPEATASADAENDDSTIERSQTYHHSSSPPQDPGIPAP
jgi:hypothetical protein